MPGIDVHQHAFPEIARSIMPAESAGIGVSIPVWNEEKMLAALDKNGLQAALLSCPLGRRKMTAANKTGDPGFCRDVCREINEFLADIVKKYPGRFGALASLPLPDVEGAVNEVRYAIEVLGLDGVFMHSNEDGVYLGDPVLEPVFAELDRHGSPILVHPGEPPGDPDLRPQAVPMFVVDFIAETTRAAANLIYSGTMAAYSDIPIILSHAGGAVPYIAWRMTLADFLVPEIAEKATSGTMNYLRKFYYETGLSSNPHALGSLKELDVSDRILFGSDFSGLLDEMIGSSLAGLRDYSGFDHDFADKVVNNNALRLFPRFNRSFSAPQKST